LNREKIHTLLSYTIAFVWIANGLLCKVLDLVPRHQQIVARILGDVHSRNLTMLIGFLEIGMAVWILSNIKPRFNALLQIAIVGVMNVVEYILAPDLLLWGKMNAFFAFLFILVIYVNEFPLNKKNDSTASA